jgi:hypothetical protein
MHLNNYSNGHRRSITPDEIVRINIAFPGKAGTLNKVQEAKYGLIEG